MLRFLSRRKGRTNGSSDIKAQRFQPNKNVLQCKVLLLDGADISVDLPVSKIVDLGEDLNLERENSLQTMLRTETYKPLA